MSIDPVMIGATGANLASLKFAFKRLGVDIEVSDDPVRLRAATHVLLPGVGAARSAMDRLAQAGLVDVIPALETPVLGICLGMQLLFSHSEEEDVACLGIIDASIERLPDASGLTIPEIGWNQVECTQASALTKGIESGDYAYFVHSYAAPLGDYTRGRTEYGLTFSSIVEQKNFFGTQFHPERSSAMGARILQNFLRI